jgi:hypothetical protein
MLPRIPILALALFVAACAAPGRVPPFAAKPYEPFARADAVAIALREWRLFGSLIDDPALEGYEPGSPLEKPERLPGLWQRVGEYWWLGQNPEESASAWTGKHDARGAVFLRAQPPESYAPKPGDLICRGRYAAADLAFHDLPTPYTWPGHCAIVVSLGSGTLDVIGGNVEDAVRLTHVPITERGTLGDPGQPVLDQRYRWFVVLEVLHDTEAEPAQDE